MTFSTFVKRVAQALSISVQDILKKVWNAYRSTARHALEKMMGGKITRLAGEGKIQVVDCGLDAAADTRQWIEECLQSKISKAKTIKLEDL